MFRLISSYDQTSTIEVGGRTWPFTCLVEDDNAVRILLHGSATTLRAATWAAAHSDGVSAIFIPDPHSDGYFVATAERFIEVRQEDARDAAYHLDTEVWLQMAEPPSYFVLRDAEDALTAAVRDVPGRGSGSFVHLHCHTEYSPLDGLTTVKELIQQVTAHGDTAVAVTDHGMCAAHPELEKLATKAGVKPIFGIEANFTENRLLRGSPDHAKDPEHELNSRRLLKDYRHLILWAETDKGLRNLWAMSTESNRTGFYGRPRMDWEVLEQWAEGVMCSTACLRGPLSQAILDEDEDLLRARIGRLARIFDGRLWVELHTNQMPEQYKVNEALVAVANEYGLPTIAVVDSHYSCADDQHTHQVWVASHTGKSLSDDADLFAGQHEYHVMSEAEVRQNLSYLNPRVVDEAISQTVVVGDRCWARIKAGRTMPTFSRKGGVDEDRQRAVDICLTNWNRKVTNRGVRLGYGTMEDYIARFERESKLLTSKGYWGYYLVNWDQTAHAKGHGVLVGPGRGSGSGSLVSYLMDITEIDPIEAGLMFERFLTEGRDSPPDFDTDYPSSKRNMMQDYCAERWGQDHTMRVGTIGRLRNKGVVVDVVSALKDTVTIPHTELVAISNIIEQAEAHSAGLGIPWLELWEQHGDLPAKNSSFTLNQALEKYPEIFALCERLVGRVKSYGRHAAGMVISTEEKLTGQLPLRASEKSSHLISEFDMKALELLGLLKFDILTLRTLDTLQMCLDLIKEHYGTEINLHEWTAEYDDPMVWDELCAGRTLGVFQIETPAGTKLVKEFQPRSVSHLADVITLVRPGPKNSGLTAAYMRRKAGEEAVTIIDPRLEPILSPTYGIIAYQEQVMAVCQVLAGYSLAEADDVRRLMGKKEVEKVQSAGEAFVSRCVQNGLDQAVADDLWNKLKEFAKYSFNKSHAWAYAMLGFWCVAGPTRLYDWDNQRYVTIAKAYREGIQRIACYDEVTGQTIPGEVAEVIKTGKKMGYVVRTQSNKRLECSEKHLILTETGWRRVEDLQPGDRIASERRVSVMSVDRRKAIAAGMSRYWAEAPVDEVQRRAQALNDGQDFVFRSERAKRRWAEMDQVERQERIAVLIDSSVGGTWASRRRGLSIECGHKYASRNEREVCLWLHRHGLEHESQVFVHGRPADFRCQGVFIEFDGIGRSDSYFEEKFRDEPYVIIRDRRELDRDLGFLLEEDLLRAGGVVTFEPIVSITPTKEVVMYDVMMANDPHNFLADGVVVHNTAWFKVHYPAIFLTAIFSTVDQKRIPEFVYEARRMNYKVLPPDINESGRGFRPVGGTTVRYGLEQIKGIGESVVDRVLVNQPYVSYKDFEDRAGVASDKRALLVACGAFDSITENRRLLEHILTIEKEGEHERCRFKDDTVIGPNGLPCTFDWSSEPVVIGKRGQPLKAKPIVARCTKGCRNYTPRGWPDLSGIEPYSESDIREREKELLGMYLSSTPFDRIPVKDLDECLTADEFAAADTGYTYLLAGIVTRVTKTRDRNGSDMAFIGLDARTGIIDCAVFSTAWSRFGPNIKKDTLCFAMVDKTSRGANLAVFTGL